jgi:hypothetical protein
MKIKGRKTLLFYFLFCIYLSVVLLVIDYLVYLFYMSKITPTTFPLSADSLITGHIVINKKSSFKNFNNVKNSNVIRIGCFGDSFTNGDEVNAVYDYPSLLQNLFGQHGYNNVEVLNFGISGSGFHQVFNVWELIGKEYSLDYIILGPLCFQYNRDFTFASSTEDDIKEAVFHFHPRYVLKNKDVELVNLSGDNFKERFRDYLSFIPRIKYLLYDIRPPAFLAAPVYCLLPGRQLKRNPFYYRNNLNKEMFEIDKILLKKMARGVPQIILCHYKNEIVNIGKSINMNNLVSFWTSSPISFPYKAAYNHNSPNGNQFLAQQLFDCLVGKEESTQSVIKTETMLEKIKVKNQIRKTKLSEYRDIGIEVKGIKLGRFYDPLVKDRYGYCQGPQCDRLINTFSDITSAIAFGDKNRSILGWVFLSLDFEIEDNAPITMQVRNKDQLKEFILGKVEPLASGLNIGIIDIGLSCFNPENNLLESKEDILVKCADSLEGKREVIILLQDIPILLAKVKGKNENLEFHPINGRFIIIRADGREIVDISKLEQTGYIYLFLESKQRGSILRIPIARWVKINNKVFLDKRILYPIDDLPKATKK